MDSLIAITTKLFTLGIFSTVSTNVSNEETTTPIPLKV
jgi:hypothetical protein